MLRHACGSRSSSTGWFPMLRTCQPYAPRLSPGESSYAPSNACLGSGPSHDSGASRASTAEALFFHRRLRAAVHESGGKALRLIK